MFNNHGYTLIESLFAFQIFIVVIILCVTLLASLYRNDLRINEQYTIIQKKEEKISYQEDFVDIIQMVLH